MDESAYAETQPIQVSGSGRERACASPIRVGRQPPCAPGDCGSRRWVSPLLAKRHDRADRNTPQRPGIQFRSRVRRDGIRRRPSSPRHDRGTNLYVQEPGNPDGNSHRTPNRGRHRRLLTASSCRQFDDHQARAVGNAEDRYSDAQGDGRASRVPDHCEIERRSQSADNAHLQGGLWLEEPDGFGRRVVVMRRYEWLTLYG